MWYLFAIASAFALAFGHKWGSKQGGALAFIFPIVAAVMAVSLMVVGDNAGDPAMRGAGFAMIICWLVGLTLLGAWGSKPAPTNAG
jgi:hypothetical protein